VLDGVHDDLQAGLGLEGSTMALRCCEPGEPAGSTLESCPNPSRTMA
jgi:hypothetical protein